MHPAVYPQVCETDPRKTGICKTEAHLRNEAEEARQNRLDMNEVAAQCDIVVCAIDAFKAAKVAIQGYMSENRPRPCQFAA